MTQLPSTMTDAELNALLLQQLDNDEQKMASRHAEFFRIKAPGPYVIRFLPSINWPSDLHWYRQFGRHGIKPSAAGRKTTMFGCVSHAYDKPCPVCDAQRVAKDSPDPQTAKIAEEAYASRRFMLSGMIYDQRTGQFGPVVPIEFTKGQFDTLKPVMRMVNPRFMDPKVGHILHFNATPRTQGAGFDIAVTKAEGPHDVGAAANDLIDLDALLTSEYANMKPITSFTGNFINPISNMDQGAQQQAFPTSQNALFPPTVQAAFPAFPPVVQSPQYTQQVITQQPIPQQPQYVQQPVIQQPFVQPPVAQHTAVSASDLEAQLMAMAAPAPAVAVPVVTSVSAPAVSVPASATVTSPTVASSPAPTQAPAAVSANDLEAQLMAMMANG